MQGNHENQNLFFELTTFFFPAKKNLVGNLQIYGILLLTRKRNFKNVDNTFGTNHSTRKTQSKNFLIFYVLHKIGIFKDAAEQLRNSYICILQEAHLSLFHISVQCGLNLPLMDS